MAVVGDMCLKCFDRGYRFCELCGDVIRREESTYAGTCQWQGLNVCCPCHERRNWNGSNWKPTPVPWSKVSYDKIGSKRKYGVEIETSWCPEWEKLHDNTYFGAKDDCSVSGKEFDSPVLYGDEGLDHLREFLAYAEDNDWEVDRQCGCHTHYDMRGLSYKQLCSVAYAYRKSVAVWKALVHPNRRDHEYSHNYHWSCADFKHNVERSDNFTELLSRLSPSCYEYIRLSAYRHHNTFEVRMLEGCLDAETLCNWIKLNCLFIDNVKDMSITEIDLFFGPGQRQEHFGPMCDLIDDADLTAWMRCRGKQNDRPFNAE